MSRHKAIAVLALVPLPACGTAQDPNRPNDGAGGASAGMGGGASAGSPVSAGSGGSNPAGSAGSAGSSSGGVNTGGTSGGASGAPPNGGGAPVPTDCSTAPQDDCPMATGLEYACKRRFALGLNYAWRNFGADFGGLASWAISGVSSAPAEYAADLAQMKANGASVIRWWVFPDFRGDGVQFDAVGDPSGLSSAAASDMVKALELAQQADVYLVPTIFSFDAFRPNQELEGGVVARGITPLVIAPARRAKLIDNVVRPLAQAAAGSPHVGRLIGWDLINEPEWAIAPTGGNAQDFTPNEELDAVSLTEMKALITEMAAVLEQVTPSAFTSVGWAAAKWSWAFTDVELDVHQPHIYGWVNQYWPYSQTPAQLGYSNSRPTVMGEFFLEAMPFADAGDNVTLGTILQSWWDNGYAGAWAWQHFDHKDNLPLIKTFAEEKGCPASF